MEVNVFYLADRNISLLPPPIRKKVDQLLAEMRKQSLGDVLRNPNVAQLRIPDASRNKYSYLFDPHYRLIFEDQGEKGVLVKNVVVYEEAFA